MNELDFNARYSVAGHRGIAFYLAGWMQVWEPAQYYAIDEEGNEYLQDDEYGEGEWIDDPDKQTVIAIMVGDDYEWKVDINDLTVISDDEYCPECGQIGCTAYANVGAE